MPQLDKVTFLSQFFWLAAFFLSFYFLLLKYSLPKISRILKLRKKKLNTSQKVTIGLLSESENVKKKVDKTKFFFFNRYNNLMIKYFSHVENCVDNIKEQTNKTHYEKGNKTYIHNVGDSSLTDNLPFFQLYSKPSETVFTQKFLIKMK